MTVEGFRIEEACAGAGGSSNPAIYTFYAETGTLGRAYCLAAMLAAISGYSSAAANCSFLGAEWFPTTSGGGATALPFPTTEYAQIITDGYTSVPALAGYGSTFGAGDLTVLGVGIVLRKETALAGRSHRGRLTTAWLATSAVDNAGSLANAGIAPITSGWSDLLTLRVPTYLKSATAGLQLITSYLAQDRLGRTGTRTR